MRIATYAIIAALSLLFIFPFYWMLNSSLQGKEVLAEYPPSFVPRSLVKVPPPQVQLPVYQYLAPTGPILLAKVGEKADTTLFVRVEGETVTESAFMEAPDEQRLRATRAHVRMDRSLPVVQAKDGSLPVEIGSAIVQEGDRSIEKVLVWPLHGEVITPAASVVTRNDLRTLKRLEPRWSNYREALTRLPFAVFFRNSFLVSILSVVGQLVSSSLVAYGFARVRFRGRLAWFVILLATMMIPPQLTMIPMCVGFKSVGWVDSLLPLIVPQFFAGAFNVFLLRQFFLTLPRELDEAAEIDGCGPLGIWWRIILPLSKPALIVVGLFTFVWTWKDLLGPLIYIDSLDKRTVAMGLEYFRNPHEVNEHLLMAASVASLVPVAALFFAVQRFIVGGLALTGLKR